MYYEQHKTCPVDKKRCDAEGALNGTKYGGVSGVCRYGFFDEDSNEPRNCDLKHPRAKPHIFTMTRSELSDHRQHGFHDIANRHTEIINPKKYPTHLKYLQSLGKYDESIERKKRPIKSKSKRCKCK